MKDPAITALEALGHVKVAELSSLANQLAVEIIAESRGCQWPCVKTAKMLIAMLCPCTDCTGLQECEGCKNCQNTEDAVCNVCQYDVSKCKWYGITALTDERRETERK